MATIRRVLAADYSCEEEDLLSERNTILPFKQRMGGRGFRVSAKPLQFVTIGAGVVISCHSALLDPMRSLADGLSRDALFSASTIGQLMTCIDLEQQRLQGPLVHSACSVDRFQPAVIPDTADIALIRDDDVWSLANHPDFPHALSPAPGREGSRFLAAIARDGSRMIAVAAACEEADGLWQIGVDVVPEARQQGLGRQVVSRVTQAILETGGVPYYTAAISNIASRSTAVGLGFWPAWTDLYVADLIRSAPE